MHDARFAFPLFLALAWSVDARAQEASESAPSPAPTTAPTAPPEAVLPPVPPPAAPPPPPDRDVTIVAAPAPPAPCAESPRAHTHDRFYLRFSQGWGYESVSGTGSAGQANVSGVGSGFGLLIGGTPGRGLVVGGGLSFATTEGTLAGGQYDRYHVSGSSLTLGPFVDWFPDPHDGWHIGAHLGLGLTGLSNTAISESAIDFSGSLFGGYDWWIGPQWSLGLMAVASAGTYATLTDTNLNDSGYGATPYSVLLEWSLLLH